MQNIQNGAFVVADCVCNTIHSARNEQYEIAAMSRQILGAWWQGLLQMDIFCCLLYSTLCAWQLYFTVWSSDFNLHWY